MTQANIQAALKEIADQKALWEKNIAYARKQVDELKAKIAAAVQEENRAVFIDNAGTIAQLSVKVADYGARIPEYRNRVIALEMIEKKLVVA